MIVAPVGSSVEYDGNTSGRPASRDDFGRNPVAGVPVFAVMLKEVETTVFGQMRWQLG
ncbi:hypothetical protein [Nonomuraea fuscirosea]|uniref:hypothetical protein n=1 Tax=Nonomuraea fuscirosea TaxID=1291556 RepID=UPI0015E65027|nr:hypothetical protein [Nonomuraea fuscirosea]